MKTILATLLLSVSTAGTGSGPAPFTARAARQPASVLAPAKAFAPPPAAVGKVFLTIEEALELAFPDCEVAMRTEYLSKEQRARVKEVGSVEVPQSIVKRYVATKAGELVGTAYVEAHKVRTMKEVVMVVLDAQNRLTRYEILSFGEPTEYIPRSSWYAQLFGRRLEDGVELGRGIRTVSGATLTARATTRSARRVLALHKVLGVAATAEPMSGEAR